jgi:ectoine hydroxylase
MTGPLEDCDYALFRRDGFVVKRRYFDGEEMEALARFAREDPDLMPHHLPVRDAAGRESRLTLWNEPGNDLYGMFSRCRRVVDAAEQLLGDEVYHYHAKMMLKEPRVGGAWEWHQDYGYWYQNGCLYPDMLSVMIAVDRADRENGCLEVLRGSHHLGRVEHGRYGEQTGADPERVAAARARLELVRFEAEPGDTLFFHSNLLHASGPNTSDRPRWTLILAYNTRHNDPYMDSHHPRYTPLAKVDDEAIKALARDPARWRARESRSYLRAEDDQTIDTGKNG